MDRELEIIEKHEDNAPLYKLKDGGDVIGKETTEDNQFLYIVKSIDETLSVVKASECPIIPVIHLTKGHTKRLSIPIATIQE